jgi:hypothetical protein
LNKDIILYICSYLFRNEVYDLLFLSKSIFDKYIKYYIQFYGISLKSIVKCIHLKKSVHCFPNLKYIKSTRNTAIRRVGGIRFDINTWKSICMSRMFPDGEGMFHYGFFTSMYKYLTWYPKSIVLNYLIERMDNLQNLDKPLWKIYLSQLKTIKLYNYNIPFEQTYSLHTIILPDYSNTICNIIWPTNLKVLKLNKCAIKHINIKKLNNYN